MDGNNSTIHGLGVSIVKIRPLMDGNYTIFYFYYSIYYIVKIRPLMDGNIGLLNLSINVGVKIRPLMDGNIRSMFKELFIVSPLKSDH